MAQEFITQEHIGTDGILHRERVTFLREYSDCAQAH